MDIRKVELDASPKPYEVLGITKTNYRSGKRYEVTVQFCWDITPVGAKFQCYTATVTLPFDMANETLPDLKAKGLNAINALKAADKTKADLIFALLNLTI